MPDWRVEKKKEKEGKRERGTATVRRASDEKSRNSGATRASGQRRDGANYIRGSANRVFRSDVAANAYFPRARFRRRLREPSRRRQRRGESSVCDRERPREHWNQPTATTINPSLSTRPPPTYHRQRCRTLSSDAVASTTISSSLPPLLPPLCSANPPILHPSTAIHRHHQHHHPQFSSRWRGALPPPVFDAPPPPTPPRLPARQVDTDDRYCSNPPSFPSSLSTFELRHSLFKCSLLFRIFRSSACVSRCIRVARVISAVIRRDAQGEFDT